MRAPSLKCVALYIRTAATIVLSRSYFKYKKAFFSSYSALSYNLLQYQAAVAAFLACCEEPNRAHFKIVESLLSVAAVDFYQPDNDGLKPIQVATDSYLKDLLYENIGEYDPNDLPPPSIWNGFGYLSPASSGAERGNGGASITSLLGMATLLLGVQMAL